jgi:hypothetical protein
LPEPGLLSSVLVTRPAADVAAVEGIRRMVVEGMALERACAAVLRCVREAEAEQSQRAAVGRTAALLTDGHVPRVD